MKSARVFLFLVVNGTWVLIAYVCHRVGVPLGHTVTLVSFGVLLSNLGIYAGIRMAAKMLRKSD